MEISTYAIAFIIFSLLSCIAIVYRLFLHPLAKLPGPKLAGISTLWLAYHVRKGKNHTFLPALHTKYGPVVRIGPNQVLVCSEDATRQLYSTGSPYVKGQWYRVCRAPGSKMSGDDAFDLLTEEDKDRYRLQRRAIGPAYSITGIEKHEKLLNQHISKFTARLRSFDGDWVDLEEWMHVYSLDGLGAITFRKTPNYIKVGNDGLNTVESNKHWGYFTVVGFFPWLVEVTQSLPRIGMWLMIPISLGFGLPIPKGLPIFIFAVPNIMKRLATLESTSKAELPHDRPGLETTVRLRDVAGDSNDTVDENDGPEPDLLASLMKLHASKEDRFRPSWVLGMALTNFGAGHDTTTQTLVCTLYSICTHPVVKGQLLKDLHDAGITTSSTYKDIVQNVPYLLACVKESQRMFPAVGIFLQRVVPQGGAYLCGQHLPPGSNVGVHPWAAHQMSEVFSEPKKFIPERWISDGSDERRKEISRMDACWLGFGGASRSCPGQHLARFFIVKLLARLLLEFGEEIDVKGDPEFAGWFSVHMSGIDVQFCK